MEFILLRLCNADAIKGYSCVYGLTGISALYIFGHPPGTMSYSWQWQKSKSVNRSKHVLLKTGDRSSALASVLILLPKASQKTKLRAGESQSINTERTWIERTMNNWGHH